MTTKAKAAGLSGARLETLDRFIQDKYIDSGKIPGALTVIARRGEVAHMSALGLADVERKTPMREDTIFRAYSMSKPITSVAFMTLVERGLVALDTPVHQVIPEWEGLGVYRAGFLDYGDRHVWVLAPPSSAVSPIPSGQLVTGDLKLALARLRAGGWAILSQAVAADNHLHIGQPFTLPATRPTRLRVAALTTNLGWPPGAIILNPGDYVRAWGSTEPSAYNITLRAGVSERQGRREIQRALGAGSALVVQTAKQRDLLQQAASRQGLSRLTQIATLVQIATVLAMSIAMGTMIWQRRPRLARMKVQGYEHGTLWRALLFESALLLGAGCSIGAVFGIYGQLLISHALASVTGFPVIFSAGAAVAISSFALVSVLSVAIVALPGYRAARVSPYA